MFTKQVRTKGKIQTARYLQTFKEGDKVQLSAEPAVHKGVYFRRFHGKTGVILGKRGSCYEVCVKDINMKKTVIVHPVHLKRAR